MKLAFSLVCGLALCAAATAQSVQWADTLIGFSSQYADQNAPGQYGAVQALGRPSCLPASGESRFAWSPATKDNPAGEWLQVGFRQPVRQVRQVAVSENFNPGSIEKILLLDEKGGEHAVYQAEATPAGNGPGRVLHVWLPAPAPYAVAGLKLVMQTQKVPGFNHIDAVGVSASADSVRIGIRLPAGLPAKPPVAERLAQTLNSEHDELLPVISADGRQLFIARQNHPENIGVPENQDAWIADLSEAGEITAVTNAGPPLNNRENNAVCAMTPDRQRLLLNNRYLTDGSMAKGVSLAQRTGTGWAMPRPLDIEDYYNDSPYGEYYLSADGRFLLATIMRKEGHGNKDVYVCFQKTDSTWGKPRNLGPVVNTAASEIGPFLAADGRTLYYATSGLPGHGSADIFMTRRLDDTWTAWSEPVNVGPAINGAGFDAYYSVMASGDYAFFSKNVNDKRGSDIYRIKLYDGIRPEALVLVAGRVYDSRTKKPLGTRIEYFDLKTNRLLGEAFSDPATGAYQIALPKGRAYSFFAQKETFYPVRENLDLAALKTFKTVTKNLYLSPMEAGSVVRINNIFFDFNKAELKGGSFAELNFLAETLAKNPALTISVEGHTDDVGAQEYNKALSEKRAVAVKNYLVGRGIAATRLQHKGWGKLKPLLPNHTDDNRAVNRRVEFVVLATR